MSFHHPGCGPEKSFGHSLRQQRRATHRSNRFRRRKKRPGSSHRSFRKVSVETSRKTSNLHTESALCGLCDRKPQYFSPGQDSRFPAKGRCHRNGNRRRHRYPYSQTAERSSCHYTRHYPRWHPQNRCYQHCRCSWNGNAGHWNIIFNGHAAITQHSGVQRECRTVSGRWRTSGRRNHERCWLLPPEHGQRGTRGNCQGSGFFHLWFQCRRRCHQSHPPDIRRTLDRQCECPIRSLWQPALRNNRQFPGRQLQQFVQPATAQSGTYRIF